MNVKIHCMKFQRTNKIQKKKWKKFTSSYVLVLLIFFPLSLPSCQLDYLWVAFFIIPFEQLAPWRVVHRGSEFATDRSSLPGWGLPFLQATLRPSNSYTAFYLLPWGVCQCLLSSIRNTLASWLWYFFFWSGIHHGNLGVHSHIV